MKEEKASWTRIGQPRQEEQSGEGVTA
jgi:hypothetical protein